MTAKTNIISQCKLTSIAITDALELMSGKWTPTLIMALLVRKVLCFTELRNEVEGISSKVLTSTLRHLEVENIIDRRAYASPTGRTEYQLTDYGKNLEPLLHHLSTIGIKHRRIMTGRDITDFTNAEVDFFGIRER